MRAAPTSVLSLLLLLASPALALDAAPVADAAVSRAMGIYDEDGMSGLQGAIDGCLGKLGASPSGVASAACLGLAWAAIHLDALAAKAEGFPAVIDADAVATRALDPFTKAGGSGAEAVELRGLVRSGIDRRM